MKCSVENCTSPVYSRGLCGSHRHRLQRYGDVNYKPSTSKDSKCSVDSCSNPSSTRGWCKKHYSRWRITGDPLTPRKIAEPLLDKDSNLRVCTNCLQEKSIEEFPWVGTSKRNRFCASCLSYKNRRAKALANYGPDGLLIFDRIEAGEGCEICGTTSGRMAIDHDHRTGKVRGLLCGNHNTALGLLQEDETIVNNLLAYIRKHRTQ